MFQKPDINRMIGNRGERGLHREKIWKKALADILMPVMSMEKGCFGYGSVCSLLGSGPPSGATCKSPVANEMRRGLGKHC